MKLRTVYEHVPPGFDLVRWLKALRRKWLWFLLSLVLFSVLYLFIHSKLHKRYHISSWFYVSNDFESEVHDAESLLPFLRLYSEQNNIENHIGALKSNSLLYKSVLESSRFISSSSLKSENTLKIHSHVIPVGMSIKVSKSEDSYKVKIREKNYSIYDGSIYKILEKKKIGGEFLVQIGDTITLNEFQFSLDYKDLDSPKEIIFTLKNPLKVANALEQGLRIKTLNKGAAMITLEMSSNVPIQEKRLLDCLTSNLIERRNENLARIASASIEGILGQLVLSTETASELITSRSKYKSDNEFFNLDAQLNSLLKSKQKLTKDLNSIYSSRSILLEFKQKIDEEEVYYFSSLGSTSALLNSFSKEYQNLQMEKLDLEHFATQKNHSSVKNEKSLSFIKQEINEFTEQELTRLNFKELDYFSQLKENEDQLKKLLSLSNCSGRIESEMAFYLDEISSLEKSLIDIKMASNFNDTNFKVLQPALAKLKPFGPLKSEALLIIILLALITPVIVVFIDAFRGSKFYSAEQIETLIKRPALATLERFTYSAGNSYVFKNKRSLMDEKFLIFSEELSFKLRLKDVSSESSVLAFFQLYSSKCGISFTENLAKAFHVLGISVGYISFDPPLNKASENDFYHYWSKQDLEDIESFQIKLEELKNKYALVLINVPKTIPDSKKILLSTKVDISIGLIKEHRTRENNVEAINNAFKMMPKSRLEFVFFSGFYKPIQSFGPVEYVIKKMVKCSQNVKIVRRIGMRFLRSHYG